MNMESFKRALASMFVSTCVAVVAGLIFVALAWLIGVVVWGLLAEGKLDESRLQSRLLFPAFWAGFIIGKELFILWFIIQQTEDDKPKGSTT